MSCCLIRSHLNYGLRRVESPNPSVGPHCPILQRVEKNQRWKREEFAPFPDSLLKLT